MPASPNPAHAGPQVGEEADRSTCAGGATFRAVDDCPKCGATIDAPGCPYDPALASAARASGTEGVVVRPLVWQETFTDRGDGSKDQTGWEADNGFGSWYSIEQYFASDSYGWEVEFDCDRIADCDDPDTARQRAQEHFEQRIRAALAASPASAPSERGAMPDRATLDVARRAAFEADAALRYRGFPPDRLAEHRAARWSWYVEGAFDDGEAVQSALNAIRALAPQSGWRAETALEQAVKICDGWLNAFADRQPEFVSAQRWACDAVKDIRDAIRALQSGREQVETTLPAPPRCGRATPITKEEAEDRQARGLHVEWAEGVGLHYFPEHDPAPPAPQADAAGTEG